MPIPYWAGHYIGAPFKERGRDIKGLDCWGLVRLILMEQFDIYPPSYTTSYASSVNEKQLGPLVRRETLNWQHIRPNDEQCGDVVVLRMRGEPMHVGLVLGDKTMIHIERGINSVLENYNTLRWKKRVVGFFRYKTMPDDKKVKTKDAY